MIDPNREDLSTEEFQAVIQSRGFQKMLLYQRLADGLDVLQQHDLLFDSMVSSITSQHSQVDSEEVTREFLSLFVQEVRTYTDPLEEDLVDVLLDAHRSLKSPERADSTDRGGEARLQKAIEAKLATEGPLELKANELAADTSFDSSYIGRVLGQWRKTDDAPFEVTAADTSGSSNTWTIASRS